MFVLSFFIIINHYYYKAYFKIIQLELGWCNYFQILCMHVILHYIYFSFAYACVYIMNILDENSYIPLTRWSYTARRVFLCGSVQNIKGILRNIWKPKYKYFSFKVVRAPAVNNSKQMFVDCEEKKVQFDWIGM